MEEINESCPPINKFYKKNIYKSRKTCSVYQCLERSDNNTILHQFPKDKVTRNRWVHVCGISGEITKNFFVCSKHFLPTDYKYNRFKNSSSKRLKLEAVPTQFLPASSVETKKIQSCGRQQRLEKRNLYTGVKAPTAETVSVDNLENHSNTVADTNAESLESNSKDNIPFKSAKHEPIAKFNAAVKAVNTYSDIVVMPKCYMLKILTTDSLLNAWTGLPTFDLLNNIIDCVIKVTGRENKNCGSLSVKERVLLVFAKFKTNLSFIALSSLFNVSQAIVSRTFAVMIPILRASLKLVVTFQSCEEIRRNLPKCFQMHNFMNTRAVLDCSETRIQFPNCTNCRNATDSHYKGTNIAKYMVSMSSTGSILNISKNIFNDEYIVDLFYSTDSITVNKGFAVQVELMEKGINLVRPSVTKGKQCQSEETEVYENTDIASARVHVGRFIQRLKMFTILSVKIDNNMLHHLDDILVIIASICNLSKPMLSDERL